MEPWGGAVMRAAGDGGGSRRLCPVFGRPFPPLAPAACPKARMAVDNSRRSRPWWPEGALEANPANPSPWLDSPPLRKAPSMHVSPFLLIGAMAFAGCATAPRPAVERFRAAEATFAGEVDEPTGEGGLRRHILNGFAGLAREDADLAGVALGIDYEYRLSERWGFGGFTEAVVGEGRALIAGVDVVLHPAEAVSLFVGYGQEQKSDEWEGIVRVGGLYEFPIGEGWTLSPTVTYDFSLKRPEEDVLNLGLSLGYAW